MAYSAYEITPGTSALQTVESWCRHLTAGGTFSTATKPTLVQVEGFITKGQADLMAELAKYGYGTAQATATPGVAWQENMNCIRAVMKVELTYPVTDTGEPNERFIEFRNQWDDGVEQLASGQLDALGLTSVAGEKSTGLEFTGTSDARMRSVEENTDRVGGHFRRGFGSSPRAPHIPTPITYGNDPDYNR